MYLYIFIIITFIIINKNIRKKEKNAQTFQLYMSAKTLILTFTVKIIHKNVKFTFQAAPAVILRIKYDSKMGKNT